MYLQIASHTAAKENNLIALYLSPASIVSDNAQHGSLDIFFVER